MTHEAAAIVQFEAHGPAHHKHEGVGAGQSLLDRRYASLGAVLRAVLRRLAVFAGGFTLGSASEVIASRELRRSEVSPAMVELQARSLLEVKGEGAFARYSLSPPTRAFGLGKLACHGELDWVARSHARHLQCIFEYAEVELERGDPGQWLEDYAGLVEDVRAALDWAFSPSGDAAVGVGLTMAAIPLWLLLFQSDELCRRLDRALKTEAVIRSGREMRLRTAARLAGMTHL
jgi:predicted ATPase